MELLSCQGSRTQRPEEEAASDPLPNHRVSLATPQIKLIGNQLRGEENLKLFNVAQLHWSFDYCC